MLIPTRRTFRRAAVLCGGLSLVLAWGAVVVVRTAAIEAPSVMWQEPVQAPPSPDALAREVFQIVQKNCIECHGEAKDGGLDLRTEAGLQKGGRSGRVVVAHDLAASKLYKAVMHDGDLQMPEDAPKLPESTLRTIKLWIESGASWATVPAATGSTSGGGADLEELRKREERPITEDERKFWQFTPIVRPTVPPVTRTAWSDNPIDAFILSALDKQGLKPVVPADKRTLVRRAYLDVLGLPPTPEEVEAFVNDRSADAWPKLVDRLLASPHYGERWARHWMDLVRYADSGGYEFDVDRTEMYRYRDYLIKAFNADKPYDLFVKEQLAGDEYTPVSDEAMIATGFLRLGPEGGGNRLDAVRSEEHTSELQSLA